MTTVAHSTVLTHDTRQINLLESAQYLEDPSGRLTLDEVKGMGDRFQSWQAGGTEMNFGLTSSAYWVRFALSRTADAPEDWRLDISYPQIDFLDFYPAQGPSIHTGSSREFSSRPYFDRDFVFRLEVSTTPEYFYIRFTSHYALTLPMRIWEPDTYLKQQLLFQAMQFMYFGGVIVLALYGLVIFLSLKDDRFLLYACYTLAGGAGMFASNGFGRQMIWPDWPAFDEVAPALFFSAAAFFTTLFSRRLLFTQATRTWLYQSVRVGEWVFGLVVGLTLLHLLVAGTLVPAYRLLMVNALVVGVLISLASVQAYARNREAIRFFVVAWSALWLGVLIATLRSYGWLPSNGFTSYALQISTVVEMMFMALALADLLRHEHQAYLTAQQQNLETNNRLLQLTRSSEANLKLAVHQRTAQLETTLQLEKNLREQYVRFGSMISHEFRTPLSIIQTQASLMRKEHERGLNHINKRLEAINSAARRLTVMFDKWLSSDAMNQSLESMDRKTLDLQPWLSTLVEANPHLLLNHHVKLQLNPQVNKVYADEYHLGVALSNLIDNASKYSSPDTTITIDTRTQSGYVGVAVTDEGPGIAPDVQDKVFNAFFRLFPESQVRGVGLGLSIVQRIAQAHGGHVTLTSAPQQGSCFCIWLPDTLPKEPT